MTVVKAQFLIYIWMNVNNGLDVVYDYEISVKSGAIKHVVA